MAMAMINEDDRPSLPDDGRPSCVAEVPATRTPCVICGRQGSRRRRRRACIACVRKFREAGVELPEAARASQPGPCPRDPLLWVMDRLTPAQRDKARLYLGELAEGKPEPTT